MANLDLADLESLTDAQAAALLAGLVDDGELPDPVGDDT